LSNSEVEQSIRNTIRAQQDAFKNKSIQWVFVSGQPQGDIVGIFAAGLGLVGTALPYEVVQEVRHIQPITLNELEIAAEAVGGQYPLKAHITDPLLMAESSKVAKDGPLSYRDDPDPLRKLAIDFAHALA